MPEPYIEVVCLLGKTIGTTKNHWELITRIKRPEIYGKEEGIKACLSDPLEVRRSSEDEGVFLYYKKENKYFLCCIVRHLDGDGFIITAYITDKIKEGETVWKK